MIREESQKKSEQEKLSESEAIYQQTPRPYGLWQVDTPRPKGTFA